MLRRLYNWTMSLAATRHARAGACDRCRLPKARFSRSRPMCLLIPMVLADRARWWKHALLCTIASVLGALLGYAIGMFLYETVGEPILAFYGKEDAFERVTNWYNTYGGWGVLFAAITPFPTRC